MGFFLPYENLSSLKDYKYQSEDRSITTKYVLKPFWTKFERIFPLWMAPNLVTLLGLSFILFNLCTVFYYDPYLLSDQPRWAYFSYAIGMFMYQTFDACDGIHARRTGQSGPLGELFDHCVDALNTTLSSIVFASVFGTGYSWLLIIIQFGTLANFYLSTWEEFHRHKLFLSEFSGPVEGIILVVIAFVATGIFGPHIWHDVLFEINLSFLGLDPDFKVTPSRVFIFLSTLGIYFNIESARKNVDVYYNDPKKSLHAYKGLIPFLVYYASVFAWLIYNPVIIEKFLMPFVLTIGLSMAFSVGRIIVGHLSHQKFPSTTPSSFIPFLEFIIYTLLTSMGYSADSITGDLIWTGFGLSLGFYSLFFLEIIFEITTYLDIYALTIKHPKVD